MRSYALIWLLVAFFTGILYLIVFNGYVHYLINKDIDNYGPAIFEVTGFDESKSTTYTVTSSGHSSSQSTTHYQWQIYGTVFQGLAVYNHQLIAGESATDITGFSTFDEIKRNIKVGQRFEVLFNRQASGDLCQGDSVRVVHQNIELHRERWHRDKEFLYPFFIWIAFCLFMALRAVWTSLR